MRLVRASEIAVGRSVDQLATVCCSAFSRGGIALLEYSFQVPANRIGFEGNGGPYSLMQLKVMQEVITLVIFVIFSVIAFDSFTLKWNHYAAMALLVGAVYLVFMK